MFSELATEFAGYPVVDFEGAESWQGAEVAYRVRVEYDDTKTIGQLLDALVGSDGAAELRALVIGAWGEVGSGDSSQEVVAKVAQLAPRLPQLTALFLGDITVDESEVSWISQSDVSPLLKAFPRLETLAIRGGSGLAFSRVRHEALRELIIESGGLSRDTLQGLFLCDFPALEHLALLLGDPNYGFDGSVEDLQPLLAGGLFPRLRSLGLMNSVIANDIAAVLVNAPIVDRLESIDLSMGNLDDEGGRSLLGLAPKTNLRKLVLSHHYVSEPTLKALEAALPFHLFADKPEVPDDDWRPILHAE